MYLTSIGPGHLLIHIVVTGAIYLVPLAWQRSGSRESSWATQPRSRTATSPRSLNWNSCSSNCGVAYLVWTNFDPHILNQELSLPPVKLHCSMLAEDAIQVIMCNIVNCSPWYPYLWVWSLITNDPAVKSSSFCRLPWRTTRWSRRRQQPIRPSVFSSTCRSRYPDVKWKNS